MPKLVPWTCKCGKQMNIGENQIKAGKQWCSANCPARPKPTVKRHVDPIESLISSMLTELGADEEPAFMDVRGTPERVARMWRNEFLAGYARTEADLVKELKLFPDEAESERSMIVQVNIPFVSICAHHMLPFQGTAVMGYLPGRGKFLLGLSKFTRILSHFAAKLQLQERLGAECADFMAKHIQAEAVFVILKAEHSCMSCRGVRVTNVPTVTTAFRPLPPDQDLLTEFYRLAEHATRR